MEKFPKIWGCQIRHLVSRRHFELFKKKSFVFELININEEKLI
jgi:hypothetical protein